MGIAPARENQSRFLVQEADSVHELSLAEVQSFLTRAPQPPTVPKSASAGYAISVVPPISLERTAQRIAGELQSEEMEAVLKESEGGSVPPQIDRRLLIAGSQALGGTPLTPDQKRYVRTAFLDACRVSKKQKS